MSYLTIYKASAGSGKTFTLAAKYTAFLLSGEDMSHARLLAVTFTNKATGEMKARILEKLYSIAYGTNDDDGFLKLVRENLDPVTRQLGITLLRKRAQERLSQLVHDYDHFAVSTIDSFFQSVLSNLAHELGLSANLKVNINDKEVFRRAVESIMQRIGALPEGGGGDSRDRQLRNWVSEFIREQLGDNQNWRIEEGLTAFASQIFSDSYIAHEEELRKLLADNELLANYKRTLKKLEKMSGDNLVAHANALHDDILATYGPNEKIAYEAAFRSHGYQWYYPYVQRIRNGSFSKEASDTMKKFVRDGKSSFASKLGALEDDRQQAYKIINTLFLCRVHLDKLRLLGDLDNEIRKINEEENHVMLARTPILFSQLIGKDDAPFVMERMGNRFEHVMIDEFQDTSPIQWNNFEKLLINNTAQGKECLVVGDVKQSIYRWRGGDWRKLNELSAANPDTTHTLEVNYRSAESVVEFNNAIFVKAPEVGNVAWPNDAAQKKTGRKDGFVRVCFNAENLYDDVAEQIRALMKEQHIQLKDIAILLRGNDDANELIDYFRKNHHDLDLVSNEAFHLSSSPAVQRLIAALRYVRDIHVSDNKKDHISKAYLTKAGNLPAVFLKEAPALHKRPLYELCESIIEMFHLNEATSESPFLFYFLDKVLEFLEDHPSSVRGFLDYWDETLSGMSIPGGAVNGIRILTIHKSKGLAYHTVLIPFCDWLIEKDDDRNILWCDTKIEPCNTIPILPIPLVSRMKDSIFTPEYEAEHNSQRAENLNLLYVAFTRAEQNLLVWGNRNKKGTTMAKFLSEVMEQTSIEWTEIITCEDSKEVSYEYGTRAISPTEKHKEVKSEHNPFDYTSREIFIPFSTHSARPTFRQSSKAQEFLKSLSENSGDDTMQQTYIQEGVLLHDIFSRIITLADISNALEAAVREGLVDNAWVEKHRGFITSRIASEKVRDWFSSRWEVFNEQAIICPHPSRPLFTTRRPDRVITDGKRTIVIDFKFARHSADHVMQVEDYCRLLSEMGFPGVEGYLWYVYNNEVVPIKK